MPTPWDEAIAASVDSAAPPLHSVRAGYIPDHLDKIDEVLAAAGFPRTSPWWRLQLRRFYETSCRQFVLRVGRRGGKSSTLCRVAVAEALFGEHDIPPGDTGIVAIVAQDRREAANRLKTVAAILDALEHKYKATADTITLLERSVAFRVYTASIAGVRGGTSICVICDEVCFWRDADTGANPATEVLSSVRPTMATMPGSRMFLSSSVLGSLDAHAKAYDEGDTPFQVAAMAETWVANAALTEADTRALEPDVSRWSREYACVPLEGNEEGLISTVLLDWASEGWAARTPQHGWHYVAAMDPGTRGNAWTLVIGTHDGRRRHIVAVYEWIGSPSRPLRPEVVLAETAAICHPWGIRAVHTDQHGYDGYAAIARLQGAQIEGSDHRWALALIHHAITARLKLDLYEGLKIALSNRTLTLPPNVVLRRDLLGIRRRVTATGQGFELLSTPDGRHSDYAQPIAMVGSMLYIAPPRPVPQSSSAIIEAAIEGAQRKQFGKAKPALLALPKQRALKSGKK